MSNIENERRSLLKSVAIAGAVVGLPITAQASLQPIIDVVQRAEFPLPDFASIKGDNISILSADGIIHRAEIVEVQEVDYNCAAHRRPNYLRSHACIVRFRVTDTSSFENRIYQLSHPSLGEMDLLLSVVPDLDGVMGLEAVFN